MRSARTGNRDRRTPCADENEGSGDSRRQVALWQKAIMVVAVIFVGSVTGGLWNYQRPMGGIVLGEDALSVGSERSADAASGAHTSATRMGEAGDAAVFRTTPSEGMPRSLEGVDDARASKEGWFKKSRRLDTYVKWHQDRGVAPSLDEIMTLSSTNERSAKADSQGEENPEATMVTVILNVVETKMLEEQLDSLFAQTVATMIQEVWVCVFGRVPEVVSYAQKVVDEADHSSVRMIVSDFDFNAYGRFQMALAAPSEFVWLLDGEVIPGKKFLAQLIHASGTELLGRSLLGSVGAVVPRPGAGLSTGPRGEGEDQGEVLLPHYYWDQTNALPVDSLSSQWFLRTKWLQYMWRERPATFETGVDFHISHTFRKHAGIDTYVMPCNAMDDETKGSTSKGLSYLPMTPEASDLPQRGALWMSAIKAGTSMRWMDVSTPSESSHAGPSALIILRTEHDVKSMQQLVHVFLAMASPAENGSNQRQLDRPWKLFLFSPTIRCARIAELLHSSVSLLCSPSSMRVFAPTGDGLDWWSDAMELEKADPAAYERIVAANLRPILHMIKARMVVMIGDEREAGSKPEAGATAEQGMTPLALERAVRQATDSYNEGLSADRKEELATLITVAAGDPQYLGFLATLDATTVASWNEPKVSLHVITNDRLLSLKRLVNSLKASHYLGDKMQLAIHVDTAGNEELMDYVMGTEWDFGVKSLHHRIKSGGLISAITESFYPADPHHYAIILEDDIEVSPAFYAWTKYALLRYRYSSDTAHPSSLTCKTTPPTLLAGLSLYTPRVEEVTGVRSVLHFDQYSGHYKAILSQTPSSWGSLYFPEVWMQLHAALMKDYVPIPDAIVNRWPGSWKRFMFSLMYYNDWYLLYPAYEEDRSFSTNHAEVGVHAGGKLKEFQKLQGENYTAPLGRPKKVFTVPLFEDGDMAFGSPGALPLPDLEYLAKINVYSNVTQESRIRDTNTSHE